MSVLFWTKNAVPFMDYLEELNRMGYMYMFQYTITPYDNTLEKNISDKSDIIKMYWNYPKNRKKRIVWRYDPILLNDTYTVNRHIELFEEMCSLLYTAVNHVVISFIDLYQKNRGYRLYELSTDEITHLAQAFGEIGAKYKLPIKTCCENYDLTKFGITKGACIDSVLLEEICNRPLLLKRRLDKEKLSLCRKC